ncbi:MAG: glycosyltransferase family 39 protein [Nitrospiraceae bacterium]|nr:MAG: glycosyltransferase family 39 protein [Nitrospiraceae bacterium]
MDISLFFLINKGMQNGFLDLVMPFITKNVEIFFSLALLLSFFKDWRKGFLVTGLCIIGLAAADGSGNILKHLIERPRPCQSLAGIGTFSEEVRVLVGCGRAFSFPSNHTVNAFAVAAIFSHFFRRTALLMFSFSLLVAFSRVYVGVHYPSDVIAGAAWGGIVAGGILLLYTWSVKRYQEKPYTVFFLIALITVSFFRYYYLVTGPIGLSPDETHYWEWSRRLDLSYYSKGPLIAYLMAFSTWLMGDTVFAVRFFAPLFSALSSLFIYLLTLELFSDRRRACAAALVFQVVPLFAVYGVVNTTDAPLLFFWTLSLYLFWKALNSNHRAEGRRQKSEGTERTTFNSEQTTGNGLWWILLGCAIGLGLLAKYTMAFFYVCAFCFLFFSRNYRFWLKSKVFYLSLLLSFVIFSPVLLWNAQHDWVAIRHAAGQAHVSEGFRVSLIDFFSFLGSQIGILTPVLFFLIMYGAITSFMGNKKSSIAGFLFWFWVPILTLYIFKSLQGKVQANWALIAYITALIASADYYVQKVPMKKSLRIAFIIAFIMAFSLTAVTHYPTQLNLPYKMDPSFRLRGWKELGERVGEVYKDMTSTGKSEVFIFSDRYQVSSELAFYVPGNPRVYCVNMGRRMNQYDIWGGFERLPGYDAILVMKGDRTFPDELKESFESYDKILFAVKEKNKILRKFSIFKSYGFKGLKERLIERY